MHSYDITVHHIFASPGHNYFTRPRFESGKHPIVRHESVPLEPGAGIPGDRFYRSRYPVTFFSFEVAGQIAEAHAAGADIALYRRNVIIEGVNLNELIGERFRIGSVHFEGISHCAPCTWMDAVIGKGTYRLMKGRGGLRAKVIEAGTLRCGATQLLCDRLLEKDPAASAFTSPFSRESNATL